MVDGEPKYVSALGQGNEKQSWRKDIIKGGVIFDVTTGEVVADQLPMPHAPRVYDGKFYVLFSATGELALVNPDDGSYEVIKKFNNFVRGMCKCQDFLFIGFSKLRQNSSTFKNLDITKLSNKAGLVVVHLPTAAIVAELKYETSVDEIYDIQILPDLTRPGILNTLTETHKLGLSIPETTYWAKIEEKND